MATYQDLIYTLESYGFTDILLPFLLIFTILFAILQKTQILGEGKKNFNVIVSLVISLLVVIPHATGNYPSGYDAVDIINTALPSISIIAVAVIAFLIIAGVLGAETGWIGASLSGWLSFVAFISVIAIFGSAAGWYGGFHIENYIDSDTLSLIVIILVFAMIVNFITREPGKSQGLKELGSGFDKIGKYFVGK